MVLRIELTATAVEAIRINSVKFHLNGNVAPSLSRIDLWLDVNKNGATSTGEGDLDFGDSLFTSGDVTFSGSPLFTVAAGTTAHLLAKISFTTSEAVGENACLEVSTSSFISATGATSSLGITPAGSFPLACETVPIIN